MRNANIGILAGAILISFLPVISVFGQAEPICLEMLSTVSTLPSENISGRVIYHNNANTPLFNCTVSLKTLDGQLIQSTETDYLGYFSFYQPDTGSYMITASNGNAAGGINAVDALQVFKHFVGQFELNGISVPAGDVNADGNINSTDALAILNRFVNHTTSFPAGNWVFQDSSFLLMQDDTVELLIHGLCYGDVDGSYTPAACSPMPTQAYAGPDQTQQNASTFLQANTPQSGTGSWSVISGSNGFVAGPNNPGSLFTGVIGTTYTLTWTISTICTYSIDTVVISFFSCGSPFTDARDGQAYNTVQIGTQCWMQENLNIGVMVISTFIGFGHSNCYDNGVIEKYCNANDSLKCADYGGLYDWDEMMQYNATPGIQGICPFGWHVPTDTEWCALSTYIDSTVVCNTNGWSGINAGNKMRETGNNHWVGNNLSATNESGFTAFGAGSRNGAGNFLFLGSNGYYWTSTAYNSYGDSLNRRFAASSNGIRREYGDNRYGYSVRCVKNE